MVWCIAGTSNNTMKASYKDYTGVVFTENTQENRKAILGHGDKVVARGYSGAYELVYDSILDGFRTRLGVHAFYGHHHFSVFGVLRKASEQKKPDWGKAWARVGNSMRTHGINQQISDFIEKMILIGQEEMKTLGAIRATYDDGTLYPKEMGYEERQEKRERLTAEWEAKHADVLKGTPSYELLTLHTQNYPAMSLPRVCKIRLNKDEIEREIEAVRSGEKENGRVWHNGVSRDLSFSIWKDKEGRGLKASYASEYSGCGNGAYYIPFSPSYAFYAEHD